jgi:hypothetical protein
MKKLLFTLGLSREAILFDSRLYIAKAILAVATGYILGRALPITRLDMISVLLGVMYNLEPINIIGVRGGINQLVASALGAACTGILMVLFGINIFTVTMAVALTLYVSLKLNWRMVSPVAIFTCIYMTQFVQLNRLGVPSVWLTFRLRVSALGVGILIAIIYNYAFSFFYYRKIAYKRLQFAKLQLTTGLEYTENQLTKGENPKARDYISLFPSIFNDLDLVYSNIETMISEAKYSLRPLNAEKLYSTKKLLQYFRDINHLAYDINFTIYSHQNLSFPDDSSLELLQETIRILEKVNFLSGGIVEKKDIQTLDRASHFSFTHSRIYCNVCLIKYYVDLIQKEYCNLY